MSTRNPITIDADPSEACQVLDELRSLYNPETHRWIELRTAMRKPLRIRCHIRYVDCSQDAMVSVPGWTRDLSRGGIGFLSRKHFQRHAHVGVTLILKDDDSKYLTGIVCYSKSAHSGWYLTGIQFRRADDERLAAPPKDTQAERTKTDESDGGTQASVPSGSKRQRTLDMLAAASAMRSLSKETIKKVILASMASDYTVRLAAIPILMAIPTREGAMALTRLLDDENPEIQGHAAQALGRKKVSEAAEPLKKLLRNSNDAVALQAAEALAQLGDTSGIRTVARLLRSNSPVTRQAVRALAIMVDKQFPVGAEGTAAALACLKSKGL